MQVIDVDTYRTQLIARLPAPIVERLLQARGDVPAPPPTLAVDAVLGRAALTFSQWAHDHTEDFR